MSQIVHLPKPLERHWDEFDVHFEPETETLFWFMRPQGRPCFTTRFLADVDRFEQPIAANGAVVELHGRSHRVRNYVVASSIPGVFNLGGDMAMFIQAILRKDVLSLESYAKLCIENMHRRIRGFDSNVSTYSLVQGRAFGGGFECALASDTIIAERSSVFCFPEVLFNMIPGMGGISLLSRRIGLQRANEIIMSGQSFTAKEMRHLGVIDEVVDDGTGEHSVRRMIVDRGRRRNSYSAMSAARRCFMPVDLDEMQKIVAIWVNAAMKLETRDLRMMARLVKAQDRILSYSDDDEVASALYVPNLSALG